MKMKMKTTKQSRDEVHLLPTTRMKFLVEHFRDDGTLDIATYHEGPAFETIRMICEIFGSLIIPVAQRVRGFIVVDDTTKAMRSRCRYLYEFDDEYNLLTLPTCPEFEVKLIAIPQSCITADDPESGLIDSVKEAILDLLCPKPLVESTGDVVQGGELLLIPPQAQYEEEQ